MVRLLIVKEDGCASLSPTPPYSCLLSRRLISILCGIMNDLETEKTFEAFIRAIEEESDRTTKNCPVLRAHVQLLTRLKNDNNRRIMEDLGLELKLDTKKCRGRD